MNENWAAENLHVIRTLMERSALYRRALAPILFYLGALGIAAGVLGPALRLGTPVGFVLYWGAVGICGLAGSFLLARRQAMKDAEPFWSPPTRHVGQALLPPLVVGGLAGLLPLLSGDKGITERFVPLLPGIWMLLYGCAIASAGFFMRQGMRVLGWVFVAVGTGVILSGVLINGALDVLGQNGHYLMGATFGLLHLVCGIYLRVTKDPRNAL